MNAARLGWLQIRFEFTNFLRNRSAMVFTLAFPVVFLLLLGELNRNGTSEFAGRSVDSLQFFVPGIIAFGVIGCCYTSLAIRMVLLRDSGVLKRVKGTPLPRASYLAGHIGASVALGFILAAATFVMGWLVFGVTIEAKAIPAILLALAVGAACMCAVALAVASLIPNGDGAPGIVNFLLFPVLFVSDVFYPLSAVPNWIGYVGAAFPLKHFANALQTAFNANSSYGFAWADLAVCTLWGALATLLAIRFFSWESKQTNP